jgi:sodium-dependent dicarboxylate transporter 2/3/5
VNVADDVATVREPEARGVTGGGGWVAAAAALVAATVLAALAPASWTAGPARLTATVDGVGEVTAELVLGQPDPVRVEGAAVALTVPDGALLDRPLVVVVEGTDRLAATEVRLRMDDGRAETIPVVRSQGDSVVASRRPVGSAAAPVLALLGLVVVLWVTELLPLWVTSLLVPTVLAITGAVGARAALAPFFHPIIVLFLAGFLLAEAMRGVGLDRTVATRLVALAGRGPVTLFAAFVVVAAVLSMFMSNTAAVAVLLPIAMAVTAPLDDVGYRRTLVLGTAYAATIGGVGSAIGTPANPLAITFLEDVAGREVTFLGWFAYGLPMVALFVPVMAVWVWRRLRPALDRDRFDDVVAQARARARGSRLDGPQGIVLVVFVAVVVGWVTEPLHGVHIGIVALLGAVVLAAVGRLDTDDLMRISWPSLLTFGGGLTLGLALTEVGLADWAATRLGLLAGVPAVVGVAAVAAVALLLTTVASNTASAAMLVPLAIPLAAVLGVDPVLLVVVVAIATSIDFALVIGTPPTMLAYSTGLYHPRELLRIGGVLDVIGLAVLVLAVTQVWRLLGLVG